MVCEVRWKFVDLSLNKILDSDYCYFFRLLPVFLFLTFHKVVWQHIWGEVGSLFIVLLPISNWVRRWKNYENRSIFSKDIHKSIVSPFFWLTVYISSVQFRQFKKLSTAQTYRSAAHRYTADAHERKHYLRRSLGRNNYKKNKLVYSSCLGVPM